MTRLQPLRQFASEQKWNLRYWNRRRRHRAFLPALSATEQGLVDVLRRDGGLVTTLDALAVPGTEAMMAAADRLFIAIADRAPSNKGGFGVQATGAEIDRFPDLIRWGLDDRLLSIVSAYIGLPVAYRGLTLRRDIAGGEKTETRLFHRDNEDNRIVKIIVYLNDVDDTGGPYEFIPRSAGLKSWRVPLDGSRAGDEAIDRLVPRSAWRPCTGQRGTVVMTDTCSVFHRGRVASATDRQALFFCYNSAEPMSPQWCAPLFDRRAFVADMPDLTALQRAALSPAYAPL